MSASAPDEPAFTFRGIPPIEQPVLETPDALTALGVPSPSDPLGPLAQLPGTWKGSVGMVILPAADPVTGP